jgi:hypothetical protein
MRQKKDTIMAIRYSGSLKINMRRLATNNRHMTAVAICRVTISRGKQPIWSRELGTRTGPDGKLDAEDYDALAEYALREASIEVSIDGVRMKGGGGYYVSRSASGPRGTRPNGAKRKPSTAKRAAPKRRTRRNPEVECREPQKRFDRYRSAKVWDGEKWIQLEGCHTGSRYVGRAEGAKKRTTISKKVVRQKASRTPSRVKGVRARKRK